MSRSSSCRPWLFQAAALLAPLVCASALASENDALHQLQRMSHAAHSLNYEGTFIYLHGNHVQSVRIVHGVDGKGEHERLVTLSGKPREVIRDNEEVKCYLPDERSVQVAKAGSKPPLPMITTPNLERIGHLYQATLKGQERVAGRESSHLALVPRDHYRYAREYWSDLETGLLLRADLVDERGKIVEQMMFTTLDILDKIPRGSLVPENSSQDFVVLKGSDEENSASDAQAQWEARSLPPGFGLEKLRHLTMPDKPGPVEHHIYGDGLASVSVFIEPPDNDVAEPGRHSRMGAVNAYSRHIGKSRVVVIGEVPAVTVQTIAGAMHPREESQP